MRDLTRTLVAACVYMFVTSVPSVWASSLPQGQEPYPFISKSDNLREVLEVFGENVGIPVRMSERVEGTVDSGYKASSREEFLNRLGARHGFLWFFDGGILHISSIYDMQTRFFSLVQWSSYAMKRELERLGIWNDKFISMPASGTRTLIVTGPEVYVTLIEGAIAEITKSQPVKPRVIVGMTGVMGRDSGMGDGMMSPEESFADQYAVEGLINQPFISDDLQQGIGLESTPVIGDNL